MFKIYFTVISLGDTQFLNVFLFLEIDDSKIKINDRCKEVKRTFEWLSYIMVKVYVK